MSRPLRVLMLSKACIVGIYQRKLELIARHNIDLLTLVPPSWRDERGEMRLERAYTDGYRLAVVPIQRNGSFHLHTFGEVGAHIRQFQPDVVHIDEEPYNVAAWQALYHARRAGAKTLFFSWQNIQRRYPPPFSTGERWVLRAVDHAIAGTESAAAVWRAKGYRGPMTVIPQFGADPDLFTPSAARPERPFTIGFVGRLVAEKGVHVLLGALARLPDPDWRLEVYSDGPQRAALAAQAEGLGIIERVRFCGQRPSSDMPAIFHRFDALALPSLTRPNWKEQFGRVLVEAMASGVPVIGSDSGAIPDVIGAAGLVTPEGDVPALADALARLQGDASLRARLGQAGRARVLERFTHAQVAADTVAVYRAMVGN